MKFESRNYAKASELQEELGMKKATFWRAANLFEKEGYINLPRNDRQDTAEFNKEACDFMWRYKILKEIEYAPTTKDIGLAIHTNSDMRDIQFQDAITKLKNKRQHIDELISCIEFMQLFNITPSYIRVLVKQIGIDISFDEILALIHLFSSKIDTAVEKYGQTIYITENTNIENKSIDIAVSKVIDLSKIISSHNISDELIQIKVKKIIELLYENEKSMNKVNILLKTIINHIVTDSSQNEKLDIDSIKKVEDAINYFEETNNIMIRKPVIDDNDNELFNDLIKNYCDSNDEENKDLYFAKLFDIFINKYVQNVNEKGSIILLNILIEIAYTVLYKMNQKYKESLINAIAEEGDNKEEINQLIDDIFKEIYYRFSRLAKSKFEDIELWEPPFEN